MTMASLNTLPEESAVVDTNIIIDLYELGRLDLLFNTFDVVSIPKLIYDQELEEIIKVEIESYSFKLSNIDSEVGHSIYQALTEDEHFRNLSVHDKLTISIANQHEYYCNSNDGLVRKACNLFNVRCLGILGLLKKAKDKNLITMEELASIVNELASDNTSCYIRKSVVKDFLENLKEQ